MIALPPPLNLPTTGDTNSRSLVHVYRMGEWSKLLQPLVILQFSLSIILSKHTYIEVGGRITIPTWWSHSMFCYVINHLH